MKQAVGTNGTRSCANEELVAGQGVDHAQQVQVGDQGALADTVSVEIELVLLVILKPT